MARELGGKHVVVFGEASITTVGELRDQYLAALRAADQGQFNDLIVFARS